MGEGLSSVDRKSFSTLVRSSDNIRQDFPFLKAALVRWQGIPMELVEVYERLWNSTESAPDIVSFVRQHPDAVSEQVLAVLTCDQRRRWTTTQPLLVEDYLARLPELSGDVD